MDAESGDIKGLVYAPFVKFVRQDHQIDAEVSKQVTVAELPVLLRRAQFFIASGFIRWIRSAQSVSTGQGEVGIIVLVQLAARSLSASCFANPSGRYDCLLEEYASLEPGSVRNVLRRARA